MEILGHYINRLLLKLYPLVLVPFARINYDDDDESCQKGISNFVIPSTFISWYSTVRKSFLLPHLFIHPLICISVDSKIFTLFNGTSFITIVTYFDTLPQISSVSALST